MKHTLYFGAASAALIGAVWLIAMLLFPDAEVRRAVTIAAPVAFGVQAVAFLVVRGMARRNVMAGWGIGIAIRFFSLMIFALVAVPRLGLSLAVSLVGLVTFLFVTTLIEPLFLKQ